MTKEQNENDSTPISSDLLDELAEALNFTTFASEQDQIDAVNGYHVLSEQEIFVINRIKAQGVHTQGLIDAIRSVSDSDRFDIDHDHRWLLIARQKLQEGYMCLARSIAKPGGF